MRLTPPARSRALAFLAHAVAAAGLGLGWLLLSGTAADASNGPAIPPPAPASVTSAVAPVVQAASGALPAVPGLQAAGAATVQRTTTALAASVESAPSAAAPVLTGPLAPAAPVAQSLASAVGHTVASAGDTLSQVVAAPLPIVDALVTPAGQAPSGDVSLPAAPVLVASEQVQLAPPVGDDGKAVTPGAPGEARDWLAFTLSATPSGAALAAGDPRAALPDEPLFSPEPARSGSGSASASADGPGAATLAAGFLLAPAWLVSGRMRGPCGLMPPSPAFDPGSTPD
ncbi:hypothetical protein [Sinomonas sp. ASV322]|uniref:hypothetical protein n=1 Tax=Sinomonas sp. ASV322 TaxID=3041920 RepID=UPI0027DC9EFB|nr:hypothetical protein [Sinomonas sp. ASV322]MDQ4504152.1 hypothetical protein [Sinomonas sp. ASV322]